MIFERVRSLRNKPSGECSKTYQSNHSLKHEWRILFFNIHDSKANKPIAFYFDKINSWRVIFALCCASRIDSVRVREQQCKKVYFFVLFASKQCKKVLFSTVVTYASYEYENRVLCELRSVLERSTLLSWILKN